MSTRSVQSTVRKAVQNRVVSYAEARAVIHEVEKGRVTKGELAAVSDMYDQGQKRCSGIGRGGSPLCIPADVRMGQPAQATLLNFLIEKGARFDPNVATADEVKTRLGNIGAWRLFNDAGIMLSRSHTARIGEVKVRPDGNYDVELRAHHFMDPNRMQQVLNLVVDDQGQSVS